MRRAIALCIGIAMAAQAAPPQATDSGRPGVEDGIRRAVLEQRRGVLQTKMQEIEAAAAKSEALAPLRRAAQEARADYDRRRQASVAVFAARAAEATAARELDARVAARLDSPERAAAIERERAEFEAEWNRLKFHAGLAGLRLQYATRKAEPDADDDPEVRRMAESVREAERALRDSPSQPLAEAREALRRANETLAPLERALAVDPRLQALAVSERAAALAARQSEPRDACRMALESARRLLQEARQEALAAIPDAQPLLRDLDAAGKTKLALEAKRRGLRRIADAHRAAVQAGNDPRVAAAREAAAAAKSALAAIVASSDALRPLDEQLRATSKAAEAAEADLIGRIPGGPELAAQIARQEAKVKELETAALAKSEPNDLDAIADALGRGLAEWDETLVRRREAQAGAERQALDTARQARAAADRALREAVTAHPESSKAQGRLALAEEGLRSSVEAVLPQAGGPAMVLRRLRDLDRDIIEAEGHMAIARYQMENERSAIAAAVEADRKVAAARDALQRAEHELRTQAPRAATPAEVLHAEAQRLYREALEAAKDDAYRDAVAARKRAEAAAQKAERDDPARARLDATRKAWTEARQAALARAGDVRLAQEQHRAASGDLRTLEDRRRARASRAMDDARAAIEKDDPQIAAARAKLDEARKALRDIEDSPDNLAARAKADGAQQALDAAAREAAKADASYQAAARELAETEAALGTTGAGP